MSNRQQKLVLELECTGIVGGKNRSPLPTPETYFNTLWIGLEEWYNHLAYRAKDKGWGEPEQALHELDVPPLYAGQSINLMIPFVNGKGSHAMCLTIYKRDEGVLVYEVTAYIS